MNAARHVFTHWITSVSGFAIGAAQYFVLNCPTAKYTATATVLLGLISKDPNKH